MSAFSTLKSIISNLPNGAVLRDQVGEIPACEWENLVRENWDEQVCKCHPEVNPVQSLLLHRAWLRHNIIYSGENGNKVYDVIVKE